MSDTRTLDDSVNESEKLINGKGNDYWANENETFATSEATTRVSNEELLKEIVLVMSKEINCRKKFQTLRF